MVTYATAEALAGRELVRISTLACVVAAVLVAACGKEEPARPDAAAMEFEKQLQTQLITAQPGDVITIPAGRHSISRGLSLNVSGVTIRGEGMDKSILSFAGQLQGAEGLLVNASDFTIEDLAIEDTAGDGLKVNEGRNIIIRRVRTEWTNGPDEKNGAYGIYPVQTENVLLEDCVAIGASDAGIYVGQSRNVVVRNNRAERNVAGIEIENTFYADVYGNTYYVRAGRVPIRPSGRDWKRPVPGWTSETDDATRDPREVRGAMGDPANRH